MSSSWMAAQLTLIAEKRQQGLGLQVPRYNPRPPGVIREGSATAAVLAFLLAAPPNRWWEYGEILSVIGRTDKATSWALLYLRDRGLIECTPDAGRNSRYLRYRATGKKVQV